MTKIQITLEASSPEEAKVMIARAYGNLPITDDDIRDYLVRKGWWKPGVENGPPDIKIDGVRPPAVVIDDVPTSPARKNISPGEPSITKIGTDTRANILSDLRQGVQPADKYAEHLKLLWKRGEVKYDGMYYFV